MHYLSHFELKELFYITEDYLPFFSRIEGRLFQCLLCDKQVQDGIKRHFINHHTDRRDHHCGSCDKSFKSSASVKRHIRVEHSTEGEFNCGMCDKTFKYEGSLNRHTKIDHTVKEEIKCLLCNKSYKYADSLRRHNKSAHKENIDQ